MRTQISNSKLIKLLKQIQQFITKKYPGFDYDDLIQNLAEKFLRTGALIPDTVSPAWISEVVKNAYIDHCKSQQRYQKHFNYNACFSSNSESICNEHGDRIYTLAYKQSPLMDMDIFDAIENSLDKFEQPIKQTMLLVAHEYTYKDISKITGTNLGTVRSRIHYGRKKLKEDLAAFI